MKSFSVSDTIGKVVALLALPLLSGCGVGDGDASSVTITPSGTFAPPDIWKIDFNDYSMLRNFPSGTPIHSADPAEGMGGTRCLRVDVPASSAWSPAEIRWGGPLTRVFVRIYFRVTAILEPNIKVFRFTNNQGGMFAGPTFDWGFDQEANGAAFQTGLTWGGADPYFLSQGGTPNATNLADNRWHWIEIEYDRNAGAYVEARLWLDGGAVVLPPGDAIWYGSREPGVQYVGGDAAIDTPTTIRTLRAGGQPNATEGIYFFPTVSQSSNPSTVYLDNIAVSTQRIGP